MSKIDDGGNAFPGKSGMSLRDYFAAQAMQGIVANATTVNNIEEKTDTPQDYVARLAYEFADAMINQRSE